jgi:hypothetical protein
MSFIQKFISKPNPKPKEISREEKIDNFLIL